MSQTTTTGERFKQALKLLIQLQDVQDAGRTESVEADIIRDELDIYYGWCAPVHTKPLSEKERQILNEVSTALQGTYEKT